MKKKIIMMMLALTAVTSVTACGTQKEAGSEQAVKTEESAERVSQKKNIQAKQVSTENAAYDVERIEEEEEEIQEFTKRLDQVEVTYSGGGSITLNVPEGYNWNIASGENENGCFFDREDDKETVYVGFWDRLIDIDEQYCDEDLEVPYYATGTESQVMTEEINGRTVYYKHISYEYESPYSGRTVSYETVKAMCEVGDNRMLVVETGGASGEKADFDEIRGFFEFEE